MIARIKQKHARGCSVAALAMITGQSYETVCEHFGIDFETQGLYLPNLDEYLVEMGYSICRKYFYVGVLTDSLRKHRDVWPVEPFGDVELCEVKVSESAPMMHFVVRLRDGTILDPLIESTRTLSDYHQVLNIAAISKLRQENAHVAWLRWNGHTFMTCDSDADGAFKSYR